MKSTSCTRISSRKPKSRRIRPALRTFKFAIEAEKEHAKLYTKALEHIQHCVEKTCEKLSSKAAYYVCPVCGYTVEKAEFDRCPVCGHPRKSSN